MRDLTCEYSSIAALTPDGIEVRPYICRTWSCDHCCEVRKRGLIALGFAGNPTTFITLTSRVTDDQTPDEAAVALVRAWKEIRRRADRAGIAKKIEFLAVFEETEQGWPHLHIIARCPFIPQQWLSDCMKELNDSPVVWIEAVNRSESIQSYIAKYCGKAPHAFKGCKRYWTSRNWDMRTKFEPLISAPGEKRVLLIESSTRQVACHMADLGWRAWETETGRDLYTPGPESYLPWQPFAWRYPNIPPPPWRKLTESW